MLKVTTIVLGSLLLATLVSAQVPRYITGTVPAGGYAIVIPPIKNNFVVASAPRSQWIVQPRCGVICTGYSDYYLCEAARYDFIGSALTVGGGSRAGKLVAAQYNEGGCEKSDGSAAFFWKQGNPDYGLVK